jgi:hypothetical protein
VGRIRAAVRRQDLAVGEERFKKSAGRITLVCSQDEITSAYKPILKANIVTSQTPSMVCRIEGISERKHAPDQRIIHSVQIPYEQRTQYINVRMRRAERTR